MPKKPQRLSDESLSLSIGNSMNSFKELIFAPAGEAFLVLCILLLLSVCRLADMLLGGLSVIWLFVLLPASFGVPYILFARARGGKKYIPTVHLSFPKKCHIPTLIFALPTLVLGTLCLKLVFFEGKYTEFSLYGSFFAHRNGNLFGDICLLLAFCILPPILEGLVFRGVLLKEHDGLGRLTATVFSSVMYALLCFDFECLVPALFTGALLCTLTYATDSLAAGIALNIGYNLFAVFLEPTLISLKNVSSNFDLFLSLTALAALICAFFLTSHLQRLYKMYSKTRFAVNKTRSTPRERTAWNLFSLALSLPTLLSISIFLISVLIAKI